MKKEKTKKQKNKKQRKNDEFKKSVQNAADQNQSKQDPFVGYKRMGRTAAVLDEQSKQNSCVNISEKTWSQDVQAIDKVAPFLKKCLYLVASKLSLEVVPFWKTQANFGDHSATMFLSVYVFCLAFSLGLGI